MHRSFYQETWPEQMFDGEEWFKLSTPPSFGFGDLINDDDQPNIGCFIIDQGSRPGAGASPQSMVIQLTEEIEYFTRSCIIIRTERVEIWRRQLTQFIIVPGWSLIQLSSSRQTTKSTGTDLNSKVISISTSVDSQFFLYACFISHKGLTISTQGLVPFYHPLNPEPSLLSKWCCNDVCNQSRNRISRQKYWTSNKCCGCCVLTAVVCCCLLLRRPQATNYQQKDVHKVSFVEQMNMSKW